MNNRKHIVTPNPEEVKHYHIPNTNAAWNATHDIMGEAYATLQQSAALSNRAGYPVWTTSGGWTVCDLTARLEVNAPDGATVNIWIDSAPVSHFDTLKRECERERADNPGDATALTAMAAAAARSVIRKCIDPQGKAAKSLDAVSDSGCNPAMVALRREIEADLSALDSLRRNSNAASIMALTRDGEYRRIVIDEAADRAVNTLIGERLGDGMDLVQDAALALLEQAAAGRAATPGALDVPYTRRRLSRRVYVSTTAAPVYRDVETTPMQEVYRAVRHGVSTSRAVQTDPRSGYTYVEDMTEDGLDAILYRSGRYAGVGGVDCGGNYTGDVSTMTDLDDIAARMGLTDRQARVLSLRMRGYSVDAIADSLGTSRGAISRVVNQLARAAVAAGIAAPGMDAPDAPAVRRPVEQCRTHGDTLDVVAVYPSVSAAAAATGIDKGSIAAVLRGARDTAGGYRWRFVE